MFTLSVFIFIGITSEFFRQKELYTEYNIPLLHLILALPAWLMQVFPMITLLALLFSLGDLSKKNEITAMKAAGINTWKIISLLLIVGFAIGTTEFAIRELIVPKTQKYNEKIQKEKIQNEEMQKETESSNLIFFMPNNTRLTIGYLNTKEKMIKDVVIEKYNDESAIECLILSENAIWENDTWLLKNGVIRNFYIDSWSETYFKSYKSDVNIKPTDMIMQIVSYDSMNTFAFKNYINHRKIFGQETVRERIALNIRYAAIFSHIIIMMIGIPFAIGIGSKLHRVLNFTFALTVAFIYWGAQAITKSFGENSVLQPFIAAWLPNFMFAATGVYILIKIRK